MQGLPDDRQVIVVDNTDPPEAIKALEQVAMFSKNPHNGRWLSHTDRGARITHLPTGLVVEHHGERRPQSNRSIALEKLQKLLRERALNT